MRQLTFEGREVEHPPRARRLGPAQREIMRRLGFDSLTSTQAGRIVHEVRGHCGFGARSRANYQGAGCCPYAASDGSAVMRRLLARGCVEKIGGLWFHNEGRKSL